MWFGLIERPNTTVSSLLTIFLAINLSIVGIIASILLISGTCRNRSSLLIPWLVNTAMALLCEVSHTALRFELTELKPTALVIIASFVLFTIFTWGMVFHFYWHLKKVQKELDMDDYDQYEPMTDLSHEAIDVTPYWLIIWKLFHFTYFIYSIPLHLKYYC